MSDEDTTTTTEDEAEAEPTGRSVGPIENERDYNRTLVGVLLRLALFPRIHEEPAHLEALQTDIDRLMAYLDAQEGAPDG